MRSRGLGHTQTIALLSLLLLCVCSLAVPAYALDDPDLKEAKSASLIDSAGNILYEKEPELELPPASTTKVMSAMVVLDSGKDLSEMVTLVEPDLGDGAQMADYGANDKASLGELLAVMIVYSGNDAAYNAAAYVAGSEEAFVERMNRKAAQIGMSHTHFVNSHGMDVDGHYSCAHDLAVMGRYAMEHYPLITRLCLQREVTANVRNEPTTLKSTDRLLDEYSGMRGVKTGAVENNYTFVGASAHGDVQLYSAVLGCPTFRGRFDDTAKLMDWGYANYRERRLSHPDWVTRCSPHAFELDRKVVVSPSSSVARTWPEGGGLSFQSSLSKPGRLLETHAPYGWVSWEQDQRQIGTTTYASRPRTVGVSSWNVFELPLFEDVGTIGENG